MKKVLLLLPLLSFMFLTIPEVRASHIAGGEIWYDYIGDSTGIPYQYCVTLRIYRDQSGSTFLTNTLCYTSSCYPGGSVTMTQKFNSADPTYGEWEVPGAYNCANDQSDPNYVSLKYREFSACLTLPGPCSDWSFFWQDCCRNPAITNLQNPSSQGFVIEAKLNNTIGDNDSPIFVSHAAKSFCVAQPGQKPFVWPQFAIENDGDSIRYTFGQPLDYGGTCTAPSWTPIAFVAGHTRQQPMLTVNGITVDEKLGTFTFLPSQSQVVVMKVDVEEYRFDTTFSQWRFIGSSTREVQVPVLGNCVQKSRGGPKIDPQQTGQYIAKIPKDSLNILNDFLNLKLSNSDSTWDPVKGQYVFDVPVVEYPCYAKTVNVKFLSDIEVMCASISPDGSEFRIIGPDSVPRPVVGVNKHCQGLTTHEVDLLLHKPLDVNGIYYLYVKPGNDGNTLENSCGFELTAYFLVILKVTDCPILDYRLENVTVQGDSVIRIDWFADPSSFSHDLFTEWRVLRSNNGSQFYPLTTVDDVNARSYIDENMDPEALDAMNFQYAIQLRQNYDYRPPTNIITSILLRDSLLSDSSGLGLRWTKYDGWTNPDTIQADRQYEVFLARYDSSSTSTPNWISLEGPKQNFFNTTYTFPPENLLKDSVGVYVLKVEATPVGNPLNLYLSESNWIYFKLEYEENIPPEIPVPPVVPNVFTPNGDLQNDRFFVLNADAYMDESDVFSVAVYNRWGKKVFEDPDFQASNNADDGWDGTDMNSSSKVADGVYYYVISLKDFETGKSEELTGQLNIFGLGTR